MDPNELIVDIKDVVSSPIIATPGHSHVYKYNDVYAVKVFAGERELEMMRLAGDCSITPRGRVLHDGKQVGIIMELGKPVDVTDFDLQDKKELSEKLISLVKSLHHKGLLHGDIKLANLLFAKDGSIRLCDFEGSQLEVNSTAPEEPTLNWISRVRLQNLDWPLRKEDDFYALGLTIWEIFTGCIPFQGLPEDKVEERIRAGDFVDVSEVGDVEIQGWIEKYLDLGRRLRRPDDVN